MPMGRPHRPSEGAQARPWYAGDVDCTNARPASRTYENVVRVPGVRGRAPVRADALAEYLFCNQMGKAAGSAAMHYSEYRAQRELNKFHIPTAAVVR